MEKQVNWIGDLHSDNSMFKALSGGDYFVYTKRDYMGRFVGYQIGQKVSNAPLGYMIPIGLSYPSNVQNAIAIAQSMQDKIS